MGHYDSSRDWEAEKTKNNIIEDITEELKNKSLNELYFIKNVISVVPEIRTVINLIKK